MKLCRNTVVPTYYIIEKDTFIIIIIIDLFLDSEFLTEYFCFLMFSF